MTSIEANVHVAFVVVMLIAGARTATAQSVATPPPGAQLWVSGGFGQDGRFDATVSSLHFDGRGADVALGYDRPFGSFSLLSWFDGDTRNLTPLSATLASNERLVEGELHVALLRHLTSFIAPSHGLAVGIDFAASDAVTTSSIVNAGTGTSTFMLSTVSAGPAASWRQPLGRRIVVAQLAVPIVALVDHPYTDIVVQNSGIDFHFAGPNTFRGVNGAITYLPADHDRVGVTYTYRFDLSRYDNLQPVRTASQSLAVGAVVRFGQSAP